MKARKLFLEDEEFPTKVRVRVRVRV